MKPIILNITTPKDQNDGNLADGLSLREALLEANANPREQYIINLPGGEYRLDLKNTLDAPIVDVTSVDQETLIEQRKTTGDLDLIGNVTLIGEDPENTIIDAFDLRTNFEARLSSLPIAPLEGGEFDLIPGLESKLISVTVEGVPRSDSPRPIGKTAEFSTSIFTIGDRIFDVENGSTLNIENVTVKNGLLVNTKEVILDLVDEDPENGKTGEQYTRTYTIQDGVDEEGNPIEKEVVEIYRLKDVITEKDIEAGGTISTGNIDTTPEGAGIKMGVGSNVSLENVIVEDNFTESVGGGIYSDGNLSIDQSVIQGNVADSGGGIHNNSSLTVNRTTIENNSSGLGTGVHNFGNAEIYNSLIANNTAGSNSLRIELGVERFVFPIGAGIFNESEGDLVVVNSTIYGNEGGVDLGGGILSEGKADIVNSTIIENTGQGGAGIWANTTTSDVTLYNTIIAQNKKPNFDYYGTPLGIFYNVPDIEGFINGDSSNNYLGYGNGVLVDGVNGNIARTNISGTQPIDIGLGSLQNNGGKTHTVSISGDSEFVDAGTNTINDQPIESIRRYFPFYNLIDGEATDQRITETIDDDGTIFRSGFQRKANGTFDIGAFEYNAEEINITIEPDDEGNTVGGETENPNQEVDRDNHPVGGDVSADTTEENSDNNESQTTDLTSDSTSQNGNTNTSNQQNLDIQDFSGEVNIAISLTEDPLSVLNMPLFRWQNGDRLGTYLYANAEESITIEANYPNFNNEGFAFRVGMNAGDNLTAFYRFHNNDVPGTYLYANATERLDILANYGNFTEEGLAFYAYDGNADIAEDVYRLHNDNQPGTYLFVSGEEKDQILANYDNYSLEGVAFEASFTQL